MVEDEGTYDLSPSKDTYRAIESDVTTITAIKELIDNTIDNWKRVDNQNDELEVDINIEDDEIIIRDNSGGIEESEIHKVFALGKSTKEEIKKPIGSYGMGAKKAIIKLGRRAEIKSRHVDAETGYGFVIDENWFDDEEWNVDRQEYEDLDVGETVIRISNLKENISEIEPTLREQLSKSYELFLAPSSANKVISSPDIDFKIIINNDPIKEPDPPKWSFTPFDSLHPRRFKNIKIGPEDDVTLHVTVGLMKKGFQAEAGTDIFCQKRKVLDSNKGEKGGYGDGPGNLPKLGPGLQRLKVIVEFETEGDADRLPWDTQKNDVNPYNGLMQEAFKEWVSRIVRDYTKATYERLPVSYTKPYGTEHPHAKNDGEIVNLDYSGRKNITDRPNTNFPNTKRIEDIADKHVRLKIFCPSVLEDWEQPAYSLAVERILDSSQNKEDLNHIRNLPRGISAEELNDCIEDAQQESDIDDISAELVEVREKVERHLEEGKKYKSVEDWWAPLYWGWLEDLGSTDIDELEVIVDDKEDTEPEEPKETSTDKEDEEKQTEDDTGGSEQSEEEKEEKEGKEDTEPEEPKETSTDKEDEEKQAKEDGEQYSIVQGSPDLLEQYTPSWSSTSLDKLSVPIDRSEEIERLKREKEQIEKAKRETEEEIEQKAEALVPHIKRMEKRSNSRFNIDDSKVEKTLLENLFRRFHLIAKQLSDPGHKKAGTFSINNEYDLQALGHGLFHIYFDDIRDEEWFPSYASSSPRVDFLLKKEQTAIELKYMPNIRDQTTLKEQIAIDKEHYKSKESCGKLYIFIYDPELSINNPVGFEEDISQKDGPLKTRVVVSPQPS